MDGTSASPQRLNAAQRSAHIRGVVLAKGVERRRRYPILNHRQPYLSAPSTEHQYGRGLRYSDWIVYSL